MRIDFANVVEVSMEIVFGFCHFSRRIEHEVQAEFALQVLQTLVAEALAC